MYSHTKDIWEQVEIQTTEDPTEGQLVNFYSEYLIMLQLIIFLGVAHAEEMWYMWRKENLTTRSNTDNIVRDRVVRLWTNFARFG